ncbi:MAG: hypothetical protein CEE42_05115 [Promethearchaeota archaeon Loki_b31]|nr:MAG: hypothetical protein CEE42_05115 [Candidatus Lokiarchaeota archaeon Loki_b31]
MFEYVDPEISESKKVSPQQFKPKIATASSKLKGKVRVKQVATKFSLDDEKIILKRGGKGGEGEYIQFCGITSVERIPLFASNSRLSYLLELSNNLDFIATSILGGDLDKMLLKSENNEDAKCQFFEKDNIIYLIYGVFPDKKGKWFLEQMAKYYSELIRGKDINNLTKIEKFDIDNKFKGYLNFIIKEYRQLHDVFSDQEIPYLEDWIRIDYIGLSSMSIGVISLLLDKEGQLNIKAPGEFENLEEEMEMKESLLTAKIEAIAANTLGNTGAYPRWIAVKLGFQKYRFLTFRKYQNDYFLSCLSEGNLRKIENVEDQIEPILYHGISTPFSGNLRPFNKLKATIKDLFKNVPKGKFT